eukprot:scaffold1900_cov183-Ochromonas_danica.AAC.19
MALRRFGQYRYAVMRDIDPSLPLQALTSQPWARNTLNYEKAKLQHKQLSEILTHCGLQVYHLPSDGHPDSVFIEDTAVVIGDHILFTRPGAPSRQQEVDRIIDFFQNTFPWMTSYHMKEEGFLDGGDVLYTGQELLVGYGIRSDRKGLQILQDNFPAIPVHGIHLPTLFQSLPTHHHHKEEEEGEGDNNKVVEDNLPLHLKSFASMSGENELLLGGRIGKAMMNMLPPQCHHHLHIHHVDDMEAANCLFINNQTIIRSDRPFSSTRGGQEEVVADIKRRCLEVDGSELAKVDGALTLVV